MNSVTKYNAELEQQLAALNAKKSERGMVITIGDLLFSFGKSDLESAINGKLDKLSILLNKYLGYQRIIEG